MRHPLPALDRLKAFEAAARLGSFTLAADELCLSKGAISYQIKKLEEQTACTLFRRSVRQVQLTDAGHILLQTTQSLFHELESVIARLQHRQKTVAINIAATTYVAARWLSSRISLFSEQYPQIDISLQHPVNDADFVIDEVDLAIQWGACGKGQDARCIGELPMSLYPAISPVLLARHGIPSNPGQAARQLLTPAFRQLPLLSEERTQDLWQEWGALALGDPSVILSNPRRVISDSNVRVQAAIDGQGMILADDLMKREIQRGLLHRPFVDELTGYGYRILCAPDEQRNEVQGKLREWVLGSFQETGTQASQRACTPSVNGCMNSP